MSGLDRLDCPRHRPQRRCTLRALSGTGVAARRAAIASRPRLNASATSDPAAGDVELRPTRLRETRQQLPGHPLGYVGTFGRSRRPGCSRCRTSTTSIRPDGGSAPRCASPQHRQLKRPASSPTRCRPEAHGRGGRSAERRRHRLSTGPGNGQPSARHAGADLRGRFQPDSYTEFVLTEPRS